MSDTIFIEIGLRIPAGTIGSSFAITMPTTTYSGKILWGDGTSTTHTNITSITKTYTRTQSEAYHVLIQLANVTNLVAITIPVSPTGNLLNYRNNISEFHYILPIPTFTNFMGLFRGATYLSLFELPSSQQDNRVNDITNPNISRTSNVTNMSFMFAGATNLTSANYNILNTTNVTTMESMFQGVVGLNEYLNYFNTFDTSKVTDRKSVV